MAYKPTMDDIKKLRTMTGAGLGDVKKSLVEAEGDFDKAKDLLRERGLAIAAKRSDRETSNGCLLVKKVDGFAAMVAVKCETDFVANGQDFIAMVQEILDQAVENRCKTLDEVKTLKLANGDDAVTAVQQRSGITGEKMEIDGYNFLEGDNLYVYDHMNRHMLATIVRLSESNEDAGHKVAMQVAAMKPIALDEASVPQSVKDEELKVAIEKTKEEQVEKAVVNAIKKMDPDREVKVMSAQGLADCKKMMMMAKAGKYNGYLLEGMACPGGCIAGAGTLADPAKSVAMLNKYKNEATMKVATETPYQDSLDLLHY